MRRDERSTRKRRVGVSPYKERDLRAVADTGTNNKVAAGQDPLAFAASLFRDGQTVTKTNPGIAINTFRVGGTALTPGPNSTAVNTAGATSGSNKLKK
ncbi:hypothetical protein [Mycobacterium sp. JS623]|uniref:hypothetical protein n=1 Tax=Mycobacterium sp. JS623 TaxID=212767 RepID=UPI0012F754FF|nr:hypothetical protein [Mycobacterium sp. JS623]